MGLRRQKFCQSSTSDESKSSSLARASVKTGSCDSVKAVAEHDEELPLECLGEFVSLFTALLAVYLLQLIILSFVF